MTEDCPKPKIDVGVSQMMIVQQMFYAYQLLRNQFSLDGDPIGRVPPCVQTLCDSLRNPMHSHVYFSCSNFQHKNIPYEATTTNSTMYVKDGQQTAT